MSDSSRYCSGVCWCRTLPNNKVGFSFRTKRNFFASLHAVDRHDATCVYSHFVISVAMRIFRYCVSSVKELWTISSVENCDKGSQRIYVSLYRARILSTAHVLYEYEYFISGTNMAMQCILITPEWNPIHPRALDLPLSCCNRNQLLVYSVEESSNAQLCSQKFKRVL